MMGNVYNFNKASKKQKKPSNNGSKFNLNMLFIAILTYGFDNLGAFFVLIFSRGKNSLVSFHSAQAMIFYLGAYLTELILSSTFGLFGAIGLTVVHNLLFQLILLSKIAFAVYGIYNLTFGKPFYIPYLSDAASRFS